MTLVRGDQFTMRCQRCGEPMELRDPAPGEPWKPDQFWVCRRCGRHFWTTYQAPPKPAGAAPAGPPAAPQP
jgi:ribosomal protein L37E